MDLRRRFLRQRHQLRLCDPSTQPDHHLIEAGFGHSHAAFRRSYAGNWTMGGQRAPSRAHLQDNSRVHHRRLGRSLLDGAVGEYLYDCRHDHHGEERPAFRAGRHSKTRVRPLRHFPHKDPFQIKEGRRRHRHLIEASARIDQQMTLRFPGFPLKTAPGID